MDDWKYIIVMSRHIETPVLFPPWLGHDEASGGKKVISAGFVDIYCVDNKIIVNCHGKSTSLNVSSRPEDTQIVQNMIYSAWNK